MTLKALYEVLVGSAADFEARHRIVTGFALTGAFVTLVWVSFAFIFDSPVDFLHAGPAFLVSIGLYCYSRVLHRYSRLVVLGVLLTYLVVYATKWFEQGGVLGATAFSLVLMLPGSILLFKGWYRWIAFAAIVLVFAGLTVFEVFHPGVGLGVSAGESGGIQSVIATFACTFAVTGLFAVAVRSLRTEVARVHQYNERIQEMARHDSLTGLLNHTAIWKQLSEEALRCSCTGRTFSVVMLDLDEFKSVNDLYGHRFGDEILHVVGGVLISNLRQIDTAGRYGGEEFLLVLPDTGLDGALRVACRMLVRLAAIRVDDERCVMASAGVVEYGGQDARGLVDSADRLLYSAKRLGGRHVALSDGRKVPFEECTKWQ